MDRVEHDLSDEHWTTLKEAWGGCAYCGATDKPLQRDCVQAISRGGRYTLHNIVPACRSCNTSKSGFEVTAWMRRKRLDERVFLLRHVEIKRELERQFPGITDAVVTSREISPTRTLSLRYPVRRKRRRQQLIK